MVFLACLCVSEDDDDDGIGLGNGDVDGNKGWFDDLDEFGDDKACKGGDVGKWISIGKDPGICSLIRSLGLFDIGVGGKSGDPFCIAIGVCCLPLSSSCNSLSLSSLC